MQTLVCQVDHIPGISGICGFSHSDDTGSGETCPVNFACHEKTCQVFFVFCFLFFVFVFVFIFYLPPPIYYLRLFFFFSIPPSRNSDPGSHRRLFFPPLHYGSCLVIFVARIFQLFLPSSTPRRIVLTHARRSQQLMLLFFLQINSKSHHGGIRTHGPTLL